MGDLLALLQNLSALAFLLLGVVTGVGWARRRDGSLGFLALAIVLLSLVTLWGRVFRHPSVVADPDQPCGIHGLRQPLVR
jgi:hypothetical protein